MSNSEKGITFSWKIEDFSMLPQKTGESLNGMQFVLEVSEEPEWCLSLYPRGQSDDCIDYLSFYLRRIGSSKLATNAIVHYTLILEATDIVSRLTTEKYSNVFKIGEEHGCHFISRSDLFRKKEVYLPQDTLTLQCQIYFYSGNDGVITEKSAADNENMSILKNHVLPNRYSFRTRMAVDRRSITWSIPNVKNHKHNQKASIPIISALKFIPSLILKFYVAENCNDEYAHIELQGSETNIVVPSFVKCKITVLSALKGFQDSAEDTHLFEKPGCCDIWHFQPFIKASNLTPDKYLFMKDELFLQCEFTFSYKGEQHVEETSFMVHEHNSSNLGVNELSTSIGRFYTSRQFCDVTLRTSDQTFSAHKIVLCACSSVFSALFENDTQEQKTGYVNITDLDSNTLNQILLFIYSDVLEALPAEDAAKLYFAADKYKILSLKRRCSVILISTLSVLTVCNVLLLADWHQDDFLMTAVLNFIYIHSSEVFNSYKWKEFIKCNCKLSAETMHQILIKKSAF